MKKNIEMNITGRYSRARLIYEVRYANGKYHIWVGDNIVHVTRSIDNVIYQLNELRIEEIRRNIKINLALS